MKTSDGVNASVGMYVVAKNQNEPLIIADLLPPSQVKAASVSSGLVTVMDVGDLKSLPSLTTAQTVAMAKEEARSKIPQLLSGVAGAVLWKEHRVLGFLSGAAIGNAGYSLYKKDSVTNVIADLLPATCGTLASLHFSKSAKSWMPGFFGYLGGGLVGMVADIIVKTVAGVPTTVTVNGKRIN